MQIRLEVFLRKDENIPSLTEVTNFTNYCYCSESN